MHEICWLTESVGLTRLICQAAISTVRSSDEQGTITLASRLSTHVLLSTSRAVSVCAASDVPAMAGSSNSLHVTDSQHQADSISQASSDSTIVVPDDTSAASGQAMQTETAPTLSGSLVCPSLVSIGKYFSCDLRKHLTVYAMLNTSDHRMTSYVLTRVSW
jgi:hypothetical protein